VLVSRTGETLDKLPPGAVIGTGSRRRRSQLLHVRPDLTMQDVRGNVDTRLRKLHEGQYDALVLAEAGLVRLGLASHISQVLPRSIILPAVGQGALGLEARTGDARTEQSVAPLDDAATHQSVLSERAMLAALRGGCLAPVGAWGRIEDDGRLHLTGAVLSPDGARRIEAGGQADPAEANWLGQRVAEELLAQGAAELISAARDA
jgi:hydroxymethylbilane synthase